MTKEETKEILKKIDVTYQTDFIKNQNYVMEWYKELKNYDYEDVYQKLEEHMRSNFSNSVPKLYFLTKGLKTPKEKEDLKNLVQICPICRQKIKLIDYEKHFDKCMTIDYIKRNVKKYLDKEINVIEYYSMSESEVNKRFDKIAKIVLSKSNNEIEKRFLTKYFETKEEKNVQS